MGNPIRKKLFQHGGSRAIDLPIEFVHRLSRNTVSIELREDGLFIPIEDLMDSVEQDPLFSQFIEALCQNALKNPDQLHDLQDVWDKDWDDLLEGVDESEEG